MDIQKGFAASALVVAAMAAGQASALHAAVSADCPDGSDTLISVPVNNDVEASAAATGVAGSVISFPAASFAANAYAPGTYPTHYVRVLDGAGAGLWANITANSDSTITVDNAAVAALIAGGDSVEVYAHHTVSSIFPDFLLDDADGGLLTQGVLSDGLQLLFYSEADTTNKAPGTRATDGVVSYTTFFGAGWGAAADLPLYPEQAFIIRNETGNDLTFFTVGNAPQHPVAYLFDAVEKDTPLGTGYPASVSLDDSGLGIEDGPQVLVQGNGVNTAPGTGTGGAIYSYTTFFGAGWGADATALLPGNSAFIYRQPAGSAGGKATVTKPY